MWYRFAGKADILKILNNDDALYQKVKNAVRDIPPQKQSKYEYVVAKFIDQSPENLYHYINKLFELHDKYHFPLDVGNKQIIFNKALVNDWFSFEQKVDELLGKKQFEKSQKTKPQISFEEPEINRKNVVEIFPINSPQDGMKFNAVLPWQTSSPWCITSIRNNQYYRYRLDQKATFYIVIDHTRPITDKWYAVALDHLPHGYFLTDLQNGSEYGADQYLKELIQHMKENGDERDIYSLTPHKPFTQEEENENRILGEELNYNEFLNLDKSGIEDAQLKYIIRGHILDYDQFRLILNAPKLLKAYLTTGTPKPSNQIESLNHNARATYEREIDKKIESSKQMGQLNVLYQQTNYNEDFVKKVIEAGGDVSKGLVALKNMGKVEFSYLETLISNGKLDANKAVPYLKSPKPEQLKWLSDKGADPNNYYAYSWAKNLGFVKWAIETYGDVKLTPDQIELFADNLDQVKHFIQCGFDRSQIISNTSNYDVKDYCIDTISDPKTATKCLHALRCRTHETKKLIEKGADINTALEVNCREACVDTLKMIINDYNVDLSKDLFVSEKLQPANKSLAIKFANDKDFIPFLLSKGLDPLLVLGNSSDTGVIASLNIDPNIILNKLIKIGGSDKYAQFLLDKGADPTGVLGLLPTYTHDLELVKNIIEKGADPNKCLQYINKNPELLRLCVEKGAGLNNAAPYAINDVDFKWLLDKGAYPDNILGQSNINRNVIFMCVEKGGNPSQALKAYIELDNQNTNDFKELADLIDNPDVILECLNRTFRLTRENKFELVKWVIDHKNGDVHRPSFLNMICGREEVLVLAINNGLEPNIALKSFKNTIQNLSTVELLLNKGVDFSVPENLKNIKFGDSDMMVYLFEHGVNATALLPLVNTDDMVMYLLNNGADPNETLKYLRGRTYFFKGDLSQLVKDCVERGAEPNNANGMIFQDNALIKWLLERGADINLIADQAAWDPQFFRFMLEKGAKPHILNDTMPSDARDPQFLKMLVDKGLPVHNVAYNHAMAHPMMIDWFLDRSDDKSYSTSGVIVEDLLGTDSYVSEPNCQMFSKISPKTAYRLYKLQRSFYEWRDFMNASITCIDKQYGEKWRLGFVKLLVEDGKIDPKMISFFATNQREYSVLDYLLSKGAGIDQVLSESYYDLDVIKYLLGKQYIDADQALEYALKHGDHYENSGLLLDLIDMGVDEHALLKGARASKSVLEKLLRKGANPNELLKRVLPYISKLPKEDQDESVACLITHGANLDTILQYQPIDKDVRKSFEEFKKHKESIQKKIDMLPGQ